MSLLLGEVAGRLSTLAIIVDARNIQYCNLGKDLRE
jgi:hypothetical protein